MYRSKAPGPVKHLEINRENEAQVSFYKRPKADEKHAEGEKSRNGVTKKMNLRNKALNKERRELREYVKGCNDEEIKQLLQINHEREDITEIVKIELMHTILGID